MIGGIGWFVWEAMTSPILSDEDAQKQELASCVQHNGVGIHIHPELTIRVKGESLVIPANIGIDNGCMHPIHTHDDSGKIHLEFKKARDVRLGEFFEMWGKKLDAQCVGEACGMVKMTVNGQSSTELGNLVMHDLDQIELSVE